MYIAQTPYDGIQNFIEMDTAIFISLRMSLSICGGQYNNIPKIHILLHNYFMMGIA